MAGIAAGHDLFGIDGFDGLAPGAQLLGLKIANDTRGGVSVTGSMVRAMEYAAAFAARRRLPLVLNLSFGIGNEDGQALPVIDSIIDAFALAHPDVVFVISAGNDGPGVSTIGFPGSAAFALSACALFPGVFAQAPTATGAAADDVLGWWSARGGVFQKPDVCVPGVAFSNVPQWQTGEEVSGGTSMAAPQLAGIAALLQSALRAEEVPGDAAAIAMALRSTATPIAGATTVDAGAGVPDVRAAWRWLRGGHRAGRFTVRSAADGGNAGLSAAYRRSGLLPGDTLQRFTVASEAGQPFARLLLRSDAAWLRVPPAVEFAGVPITVPVVYDARTLQTPGLYVGTAWARPATDTLAGAAFGLTSSIVVPHALDRPLRTREYVPKGRSARFFLDVPAGAGGLSVRASVTDEEQVVSLYLFEPTGRPQRDEATAEIGGQLPATGALLVRAEDLVSGVYEAVLVASPTRGVTVDFEAQVSPVRLAMTGTGGIDVTNRSEAPVDLSAAIRTIGGGRRFRMHGGPDGRRPRALGDPVMGAEAGDRGRVPHVALAAGNGRRGLGMGFERLSRGGESAQLRRWPAADHRGSRHPPTAGPRGDAGFRAAGCPHGVGSRRHPDLPPRGRDVARDRDNDPVPASRRRFHAAAVGPGFAGLASVRTRRVDGGPGGRRRCPAYRPPGTHPAPNGHALTGPARTVRVASGQGFWGDWLEAPVRQVEGGPIDYLMMDYLAEVTMSIMQKQRSRDPSRGYASDFVPLMERILPTIVERGIRVTANAGGVNPQACAEAVVTVARKLGLAGRMRVGIVAGDDIMDRLDELIERGHALANMDTGEPLARRAGARPLGQCVPWRRPHRRSPWKGRQRGDHRSCHRHRPHLGPADPRVRVDRRRLGPARGRHCGRPHHRVWGAVFRRELSGRLGERSPGSRIRATRSSRPRKTARSWC